MCTYVHIDGYTHITTYMYLKTHTHLYPHAYTYITYIHANKHSFKRTSRKPRWSSVMDFLSLNYALLYKSILKPTEYLFGRHSNH